MNCFFVIKPFGGMIFQRSFPSKKSISPYLHLPTPKNSPDNNLNEEGFRFDGVLFRFISNFGANYQVQIFLRLNFQKPNLIDLLLYLTFLTYPQK